MDTALQRIRQLDGVSDALLAELARSNPTLLQLELLTSCAAIRQFLLPTLPQLTMLQQLDGDTLARYALLEPTEAQM